MAAASGGDDAARLAAQVRANLEERHQAALDEWQEAERALERTLRASKREAEEPPRPTAAASLLPLSIEDLPEPPRRRFTWRGLEEQKPPPAPAGPPNFASDSPEAVARRVQRDARVAAAREAASETRAAINTRVACEARDRLAGHNKRKLRAKIIGIIKDEQRQQTWDAQQAKQARVLEDLAHPGRGSAPLAGTVGGDTVLGSLSFGNQAPSDNHLRGASPRRTRLLETLSDQELDSFRKDPRFFLQCPGLDPEAAAPGGGTKGATHEHADAAPDASVEELVEFFTPTREEKDNAVSVQRFARRLRGILAAETAEAAELETSESAPQFRSTFDPQSAAPLERMPCQGRRPAARRDDLSPTLAKVREVYDRKDLADAKWLEDKRQAMVRRIESNEFKAREQQKEMAAFASKQREMTKIRMMEAEERKTLADASSQERWDSMDADFQRKHITANNQAVDALEARRARAAHHLDEWEMGARRAEHCLRMQEQNQVMRAEQKWNDYMGKLWKLGETKHNAEATQAHKNDQLRMQIQSSLRCQIKEQETLRAQQLAEEVDAKLQAAAERRHRNLRGSRYNLIDKAFGSEARRHDPKFHAYYTDRRGASWKASSEAWDRQRATLSGAASPLSGSASSPMLRSY